MKLPPSMKDQQARDLKNLADGAPTRFAHCHRPLLTLPPSANFHLLRAIPTELQQGRSLNRWQKGIFFPWDLEEPDTSFPYQYGIDGNMRPSLSVIKVMHLSVSCHPHHRLSYSPCRSTGDMSARSRRTIPATVTLTRTSTPRSACPCASQPIAHRPPSLPPPPLFARSRTALTNIIEQRDSSKPMRSSRRSVGSSPCLCLSPSLSPPPLPPSATEGS
jgi:hypothetical protein